MVIAFFKAPRWVHSLAGEALYLAAIGIDTFVFPTWKCTHKYALHCRELVNLLPRDIDTDVKTPN